MAYSPRTPDEARSSFHAEAEQRLASMKRSGKGIPAGKAFDYLRGRARGNDPARPKAIKAV